MAQKYYLLSYAYIDDPPAPQLERISRARQSLTGARLRWICAWYFTLLA